MMLQKSNIKNFTIPYIVFVFLLNLYLLYPGNLFYDSMDQFTQAIRGKFNSHHPPVMAFWWSIMMKIWPNPATMLIFHLLLLWAASFNFYKFLEHYQVIESKQQFSFNIIYLLLPFSPWILLYSACILKDVSFSYSYLFVASMLARFSNKQQGLTPFRIAIILLILFYGTAVKYQARFILPVFSWWLASAIINNNKYRKLLVTVAIFCFIYLCQTLANNLLISSNKSGDSNSWQFVKLHDLAAISTETNSEFIPDYMKKNKEYDFDKIKKAYNTYSVDSLIYAKPIIFMRTNKDDELKQLYDLWIQAVIKHPLIYLKHRLIISKHTIYAGWYLNTSPVEIQFPTLIKHNVVKFLSKKNLINFLSYCSKSTSLQYWIFFLPLCMTVGFIINRKFKDECGKILIMMNLCGLAMMIALLPFSMSSDSRYLLIALVMINYSLPIALSCINTLIRNRTCTLVTKHH